MTVSGHVHTYAFSNQHRFQKSLFSSVHTTTQCFRKSPFSKVSTFKPVFESLHLHRTRRLSKTLNKSLRVDVRRKRTEKSPFSHENVYVWTWPQMDLIRQSICFYLLPVHFRMLNNLNILKVYHYLKLILVYLAFNISLFGISILHDSSSWFN